MPHYDLWKVVGDFNLMRSPKNRNRPGGNPNDMLLFNDIIHHLDLVEIPLKRRAFTLSNMQQKCLLKKIDWVLTSSNWAFGFSKHFGIHPRSHGIGSRALCNLHGVSYS
jgi:hypothetical protein